MATCSSKGSTISFQTIRAASIAELSNGSTGNERSPRGTSHSRGKPTPSRAWPSAPTGSSSASRVWMGRCRCGTPGPDWQA